jgi:hypothetical protein
MDRVGMQGTTEKWTRMADQIEETAGEEGEAGQRKIGREGEAVFRSPVLA